MTDTASPLDGDPSPIRTPGATAVAHSSFGIRGNPELLSAVWESATDAMVLSDSDGIVVAVNPAYLQLYGYGIEEVIGHSFAIIFPPDQRETAVAEYRRIFVEQRDVPEVEAIVRRADGQERHVDARYDFIEKDGRRSAMLSIIRDVTDRVRLREAERSLAAQKDDFLLTVSHDLKTPVTSILGNTQLLQRHIVQAENIDPIKLEHGLGAIESTARRMTRLIDGLIDVTSIQMGQPLALHRTETDLCSLVRQAVASTQQTADTHQILVQGIDRSITGHWDDVRLQRVIDNLLSNAVKYSPDGGTIVISVTDETEDDGCWGVLRVQDEGIGIAEGDLLHIFERFYRAHLDQRGISGSGIGLAGVKQIVEQHGGTVGVQSRESEGSTFTVRLPARGQREGKPGG